MRGSGGVVPHENGQPGVPFAGFPQLPVDIVEGAASTRRRGEAGGRGSEVEAPAGLAPVAGLVQGVLRKGQRAAEGSTVPRQGGRRARGEGDRAALAEHFRHGVPRESIFTRNVDGH